MTAKIGKLFSVFGATLMICGSASAAELTDAEFKTQYRAARCTEYRATSDDQLVDYLWIANYGKMNLETLERAVISWDLAEYFDGLADAECSEISEP